MSASPLKNGWKNPSTLKQKSMRDGHGEGLVEAGKYNENFHVICADVTNSVRADDFKKTFPNRFVQIGVSEQSMATIAAGMALVDKTVAICAYGAFSPGRNWEQIRTTIALQNTNVKILSSHCGITVGADGATHQMTEDIALMRSMPNMIVIAPADSNETKKAVIEASKIKKPVYIRFERPNIPVFTTTKAPFKIGKAQVLRKGNDIALIGCGSMVYTCLLAAEKLSESGIEAMVINNSTIKPLDEKTLIEASKKCKCAITIENHQVNGGMGSAICEFLSEVNPIPIQRLGIQDKFGQSGKPNELLKYYHMTVDDIIKIAKKLIKKKT